MIKKEENGTWSVRCWYRNWRGERKQKTKRGFTKLKDAKQWEREFLAQEQKQVITMGGLINAFLLFQQDRFEIGDITDSTYELKKSSIERYVKPYFKDAPVENVSVKVVNEWILWLNKNFGRKQLASTTQAKIVNYLSQIFDYGIQHYGLRDNPTTNATTTTGITTDTRAKYWDVDTYNKFYASLIKPYHRVLFDLLYWGGLRAGEVLGLTPDDLTENGIVINKQYRTMPHKRSKIGSVKTKSSKRIVILPHFVFDELKAFLSVQDYKPTDRIFPITRGAIYKVVKMRIEELGLPNASPHTLRHSYATNFLAESKDYVSAAAQLGHANPKITFGIYAHRSVTATQNSVDLLEKLHKNP